MLPDAIHDLTQAVSELLQKAQRALSCSLCYHDHAGLLDLPKQFAKHNSPACEFFKESGNIHACLAFDGQTVRGALAGNPGGRIHICPAGFVEIAVPVLADEILAGVIFAGTFSKAGAKARAGLRKNPGAQTLDDKRELLRALALRISQLLSTACTSPEGRKRATILSFLHSKVHEPVTLGELAKELHLSPSRAGKVVRGLFKRTFPHLNSEVKMDEASRLLRSTDTPIIRIALALGYGSQSAFSECFRRCFKTTPAAYRRCPPV